MSKKLNVLTSRPKAIAQPQLIHDSDVPQLRTTILLARRVSNNQVVRVVSDQLSLERTTVLNQLRLNAVAFVYVTALAKVYANQIPSL